MVLNHGLKIFAHHHQLFKKLIIDRAKDLFELLMTLVVHKNRDVKENVLKIKDGEYKED